MVSDIDISILICTRDRSDYLQKNLESIENIRVSDGLAYEVLLIDNGSTDGTRELAETFVRKRPELYKYHFEPQGGKSNALNSALSHARGEILVFTDDDVIVDENWIQAILDTFARRDDAIAVQGKILLQKELGRLPEWYDPDYLIGLPYFDPSPTECPCDTLVGANMAIRREAFEKYDLFDPRLGKGGSGSGFETEFCTRLRNGGEKIIYQPEAVVFHEFYEHRLTWEYLCERAEQLASNHAYFDITLKRKKINWLGDRRKLIRYYMKYLRYLLLHNQRKRYKYDRKIRYMRTYLKCIEELRRSQVMH